MLEASLWDDCRSCSGGDGGGVVGAEVVHDDDLVVGVSRRCRCAIDVVDGLSDGFGFVVCWDDKRDLHSSYTKTKNSQTYSASVAYISSAQRRSTRRLRATIYPAAAMMARAR